MIKPFCGHPFPHHRVGVILTGLEPSPPRRFPSDVKKRFRPSISIRIKWSAPNPNGVLPRRRLHGDDCHKDDQITHDRISLYRRPNYIYHKNDKFHVALINLILS